MRITFNFFFLILIIGFTSKFSYSQKPVTIDFCDLFKSQKNNGTIFITNALLFSSTEYEDYFYSLKCNNQDNFALADFTNTNIKNQLIDSDGKTSFKIFQVSIKGTFSKSLVPIYGHLNFLRARFEVYEIKSVKDIKSVVNLPDFKKRAPITERVEALKTINNELIFSLFQKGSKSSDIVNLIETNTKLTFDGREISSDNFLKEFYLLNSNTIIHKVILVDQIGKRWKVEGIVINKLLDNIVSVLNYETYYLFNNDEEWKLIYLKTTTLAKESEVSKRF